MEKIIEKQSIPEWVKQLEDYIVYTPVKKDEAWSFEAASPRQPGPLNLEYPNSIPSPKKVLFPQREVFFEFKGAVNGPMEIKETLPGEKPRVILGIRPCDAAAIERMDKFFAGDIEDPYYLERRKNTFLVGLACNTPPSPNCFCTAVDGSPHGTANLDILMTDLGDTYYLESLTSRGVQLMDLPGKGKLFREAKAEERKQLREIHEQADGKLTRGIENTETLAARMDDSFESQYWNRESKSCISCGICTYLCPSCHCFDMNDEVSSTAPLRGERVRTWDNCQFPDFTMHSSGHNPRPDKASRLRQRIYHKFRYSMESHGNYLCTGCGRCVSRCPVGIDIIEILNKLQREVSDDEQ
jgi:ferredoxin